MARPEFVVFRKMIRPYVQSVKQLAKEYDPESIQISAMFESGLSDQEHSCSSLQAEKIVIKNGFVVFSIGRRDWRYDQNELTDIQVWQKYGCQKYRGCRNGLPSTDKIEVGS